MKSNSKILTVSYGTFSCTLEGFDDSFGAMKAIAEYFRNLSAEDRYFGAEPPQPDTEMLQRIAEREISRRVEARHHEGQIFLSATDANGAASSDTKAEDTAKDAADVAAAERAEAKRQADAEREAQAEMDRVQAKAAAKAKAEADAKATAKAEAAAQAEADADAARIIQAAQAAEDEAAEASEPVEVADPDLSALIAHAEATDTTRTPRDLAAELPQAEAFFAGEPQADAVEVEDAPAAANDSIAAKLYRIRAVVSQAEGVADDDDGYSEDEHAEDHVVQVAETAQPDVVQDDDSVAETALADIQAALAADDETQDDAPVVAVEDDDDDVASILASLEDDDDDADQSDVSPAANLFEDAEDADVEIAKLDIPEAPQDAPRRMARVIKVKRADLEAAIAQGDLEEVDDEEGDIASSLSDDDEAELARELAEVSAEIKPEIDLGDLSAHALPGIEALQSIDENTGDDVSRLMAQADEHMDEEEGAQRRDAFAHLRAAVAAKKADTGLGEVDAEKEEVAYRDDLATAVKPRRPSAEASRVARPDAPARPVPLKLVAEQRVDSSNAATSGPVRPRRVAATQEAEQSVDDAGSFAEFADDMGASNLSDLLEAAAAYMSFVEGREQFSRPQLMTKVRQVEKDDFSREDGLRSFGKLLRAGKIEKLKGGRFAVTGDIGFRPDARAAG
ncbi:MAG: hypothetical protein P8Q26_07640 [Ascidiaceihabitans sp.]|nr:hypothetical protein [Ascidiaceihabitans sp.]